MSRRHRRKRKERKASVMDDYLKRLREAMIDGARKHFGAEFTPELEAFFRAELAK